MPPTRRNTRTTRTQTTDTTAVTPSTSGLSVQSPAVQDTSASTMTYSLSRSFSTGGTLTPVSEADYETLSEEIKGLTRAAKLTTAEWNLKGEVHKAEQSRIGAETEGVKVQTKIEGYKQAQHKLQQAQTVTQIEAVNTQTVQRDLQGYQVELTLKSEAWDIKIDNLQTDVQVAREILAQKRAAILGQIRQGN